MFRTCFGCCPARQWNLHAAAWTLLQEYDQYLECSRLSCCKKKCGSKQKSEALVLSADFSQVLQTLEKHALAGSISCRDDMVGLWGPMVGGCEKIVGVPRRRNTLAADQTPLAETPIKSCGLFTPL